MSKKIDEIRDAFKELTQKQCNLGDKILNIEHKLHLFEDEAENPNKWLAKIDLEVHEDDGFLLTFFDGKAFDYEETKKIAKWLQELFLEESDK